MDSFEIFNLPAPIINAVSELGFDSPTPIQREAFSVVMSGKDVVGIAQTGTGKTLAYILPLLNGLKYSDQINPRILVLVPTRELVIQITEDFRNVAKNTNVRILGVYGGTNIKTQKQAVSLGCDILVATPGRLYDLALTKVLQLKGIKKVVIDEVDVMLDLGFRYQLTNIFEILPDKRQHLMFSATMTDQVSELIQDTFVSPVKISIAVSGTPLENIEQCCYPAKNFNTKINLLIHLLRNRKEFSKVIVFVPDKKSADRIHEALNDLFGREAGVIHSNKTQNYRIQSIQKFEKGDIRILVATDVISRGIDLDKITHVISFDTPAFPENYMHRIGRTGRAEKQGKSILFYTSVEESFKKDIESLMNYTIPEVDFPEEVEISDILTEAEKPVVKEVQVRHAKKDPSNSGFHEKKEKNLKTNTPGGAYGRKKKAKYKKPITRGDKTFKKKRGKK